MNERERKEFEDYFKTTKFYENMVKSLVDHNFPAKALDMQRGKYKSIYVQLTFDAWLASANREGYKLVPLQPNNKIIVSIERAVENQIEASGITQDPFRLDGEKIYEAMIGAVDDH